MKRLFYLFLLFSVFSAVSVRPARARTTVDCMAEGSPLDHWWSVGVGAGRVNEGLRAGWLEHLSLVHQECGFQYVRMHNLFGDDMFVYFEGRDGTPVYNWQYVDEVYDRMLAIGVRPFVELSFFPEKIAAKDTHKNMWYRANITLDQNNFGKWHDLVHAFVRHVVDRYGIEEVLYWYFEVWNEPNLYDAFLDGTRSDYFRLYKEAANAVKEVDPRLKVGGPATSNFIPDHRHDGEITDSSKSRFYPQETINKQQWKGIWIEDFLDYCKHENLPVDFVSCHPYPTDYAFDPKEGRSKGAVRYVDSVRDDINWLRKIVSKSAYPDVELHLTEWSTSPGSRDAMHDLLPPAAYIIKVNLDCQGMANSLMYWTFTDVFEEQGGGPGIFHGGFGMVNYQGLVKPSFHAFRMLNDLGDEMLYYKEPVLVSRDSGTGKIVALAYNYPEEFHESVPAPSRARNYMDGVSSKWIDVTLTGLAAGSEFEMEILDENHGNVYKAYVDSGCPHSPTREETKSLNEQAWATLKKTIRADDGGSLRIHMEMEPWMCVTFKEL